MTIEASSYKSIEAGFVEHKAVAAPDSSQDIPGDGFIFEKESYSQANGIANGRVDCEVKNGLVENGVDFLLLLLFRPAVAHVDTFWVNAINFII